MREQLERRLIELKAESESGQKALAELEMKQSHLQSTLLRISGAIQVLEELKQAQDQPELVRGNGHFKKPEEATVGQP